MSFQYLVKFPFSVIIPEEVAKTTPNFQFEEFSFDPLILNSGEVILINNIVGNEVDVLCQENPDIIESLILFESQMQETLTLKDDSMIGTVTFNSVDDPTGFINMSAPYGVEFTPITA
jgi:hypothetical protein